MAKYQVYIKINKNSDVVNINSNVFIRDYTNWIKVDEGDGNKYAHAQSGYLNKPLFNKNGTCNYKYINGKIVEV
jgi:hypothetical protein